MVTTTSIRRRLESLVVPPVCVLCRSRTGPMSHLCGNCEGALSEMPRGEWWWDLLGDLDLPETCSAFHYEGLAKELVLALKFRGSVAVAREMAELMLDRVGPHLQMPDMIVPVPAHPERERQRGYNQSLILARAWSAVCDDRPVVDCLRRNPRMDSSRAPQGTLHRAERLALPRDAIVFDNSVRIPDGLTRSSSVPTYVLLLDDVMTTGVTLDRCASAIRERFPSDVKAVTFASTRAKPGHDSFG